MKRSGTIYLFIKKNEYKLQKVNDTDNTKNHESIESKNVPSTSFNFDSPDNGVY